MAHLDIHHQTTSGLQRSMQWHDRARGHGIVQGGIARPGMEPDRAAIPLEEGEAVQRGLLILVVTERLWGKVNAAGQPYTYEHRQASRF